MKMLLSILLFVAALTQSLFAQTTTLTFPYINGQSTRQQNIQVLAGETFELLLWSGGSSNSLTVEGIELAVTSFNLGNTKIIVAGPKTVSVSVPDQSLLAFTYRLATDAPASAQNVASQAVVIPENASGPVDVILESSTDLINWTAAVAGSYAPSTLKRFFRVRLVTH